MTIIDYGIKCGYIEKEGVRVFRVKFDIPGHDAYTLETSEVAEGEYNVNNGEYTKIHEDGWMITGSISEDYYEWVNEFRAKHKELGEVWGNFEAKVYATSKEAYESFYYNHTPSSWDYYDI